MYVRAELKQTNKLEFSGTRFNYGYATKHLLPVLFEISTNDIVKMAQMLHFEDLSTNVRVVEFVMTLFICVDEDCFR